MSQASELKAKFTTLLKSMFQLDQPELDFGLYKIMHSKADRIHAFLDKELDQQIDAVFADADQAEQNQAIEAAKRALISQLGEEAFDDKGELVEYFKTVPAAQDYLKAVAQAKSGKGNLSSHAVIYDHLIRFFSRYYDGGDFMSRRYHVAENKSRAAAYAVPYDGSEVYLHWANKDQYYIKTTESFQEYSFDIAEAAKKQAEQARKQTQAGTLDLDDTPQLKNKRIHFKLIDAKQGEHNNNKESEKRQFFIDTDKPLAINEQGELEIYFHFRVATKDDVITPEQEKQLKARYGKRANKRDLPNLAITRVIQDQLAAMQDSEGFDADYLAFAQLLAPTDKLPQRPLITKYLNNYTSKNTLDYFIHKDLGGFLQRELDFYIKNEIMRLDDVEQADAPMVETWLQQIKVLRRIAKDIITFLAQLEDFQKKLWLKKKFVTETQYCFTLDFLSKSPALLEKALNNPAQRDEWVSLFAIDLQELDEIKAQGCDAVLAHEKFKYLVLDTQFFDNAFKDELLAEIEDLDEQSSGVLIHSENFQALNLMQEKYREQVKCIYIDPPYNTGGDGFMYKDSYQHSSWLSMIHDRVILSTDLMHLSAPFFSSIDQDEWHELRILLSQIFGFDNYVNEIVWQKLTAAKKQSKYFSNIYEKIIVFRKSQFMKLKKIYIQSDKDDKNYSYIEKKTGRKYGSFDFTQKGQGEARYFGDRLIEPPKGKHWIWGQEKINKGLSEDRIIFTKNGIPRVKRYLDEKEGNAVGDLWVDDEIKPLSANDRERVGFDTQKPSCLINRVIKSTVDSSLVLDYFAGSGTTGHAVINLNREDQGSRKYILVEMGNYFDTVTKPRIQKVIYAKDWKEGKPVFNAEGKAGGVSQCFKYLRLEQYEDTLNNLVDSRTYDPETVPKDFMLSYLLEAETAESPSLLNLDQFKDPAHYQLKIKRPNSDESKPQTIDLIETFNWLIGLNVVKLDKWRAFECEFAREKDPELPEEQHTRLRVVGRLKQGDGQVSPYQIRTVEGWVRQVPGQDELRDSVLVIWRKLTDDPEKDSAFLEAYMASMGINQADTEFDKIYINGPHGLQLHGSAKTRLLSIEEAFMQKMWEGS